MKSPTRLCIDDDATDLERALLRAARAAVPVESKERALAACAGAIVAARAGALAKGAATVGATGATSKAASTLLLVLKCIGVVGVAGAGVAIVSLAAPRTEAPRVDFSSVAPTATTVATIEPTASEAPPRAPPLSSAPAPTARAVVREGALPAPRASASAAPTVQASTLGGEIVLLDQARAAIANEDAKSALAALDAYAARFPHGSMAPEGTMLRVEALAKAGDHAAANALVERFLSENPTSPYTQRARSLVDAKKKNP